MKDSRIEEYFASAPEMPQSLSKEAIIKRIEAEKVVPEAPKKSGEMPTGLVVAVFAVILAVALVLQNGFGNINVAEPDKNAGTTAPNYIPHTSAELPEGVYTFENEQQIRDYFADVKNEIYYTYTQNNFAGAPALRDEASDDMVKEEMAPESPTQSAVNSATGSAADSFTGTNTQNSADEGDVIKNDGRHLYIISGANGGTVVNIVDTKTMERLCDIPYSDESKGYANDLYVNGDTLVVLYRKDAVENKKDYRYVDTTTLADIYDIADRSKPELIRTVSQQGHTVSSRMIGTVLYTVTSYTDWVQAADDHLPVPEVNGLKVSCSDIIHFDTADSRYTVITATDTADKDSETTSLSVLSPSNQIYCSESNLYILRSCYNGEKGNTTAITKISLDGTKLTCTANGEVKGSFNNNYSFDEYEGNLRVVTTNYNYKTYKNECALHILDGKLELIGSIDDITGGLNEEVKSVRFMGDVAYVVTFEQTDPLFVLDLSEPTTPVIKGELFMPGYSTYLHPLGGGMLLGIGYGGDEENADLNKLKIALYDVSDMTKPEILDEFIINNGDTTVNYNPKALIHYAAKNIIGIPVTVYDYTGYGKSVNSYAVITYADNKLSSVEGFVHAREYGKYYSKLFRGTCIDDFLYTVDDYCVIEHGLSDGEEKRSCKLKVAELREQNSYSYVVPGAFPDGDVIVTSPAQPATIVTVE